MRRSLHLTSDGLLPATETSDACLSVIPGFRLIKAGVPIFFFFPKEEVGLNFSIAMSCGAGSLATRVLGLVLQ